MNRRNRRAGSPPPANLTTGPRQTPAICRTLRYRRPKPEPRPMTDLHTLTATQATRLIQSGKLTPSDLTEACLARIAEREPQVRAFHFHNPEQDIWYLKAPLHL